MCNYLLQDFNTLIHYMEQFPPSKFFEAVSDFHLLMYLATTDMLPLKVIFFILMSTHVHAFCYKTLVVNHLCNCTHVSKVGRHILSMIGAQFLLFSCLLHFQSCTTPITELTFFSKLFNFTYILSGNQDKVYLIWSFQTVKNINS